MLRRAGRLRAAEAYLRHVLRRADPDPVAERLVHVAGLGRRQVGVEAEDDNGEVIAHVTNSNNGSGTYNTTTGRSPPATARSTPSAATSCPVGSAARHRPTRWTTMPVYSAHSRTHATTRPGSTYPWSHHGLPVEPGLRRRRARQRDVVLLQAGHELLRRDEGATVHRVRPRQPLDRIDYGFTDGNAYGPCPTRCSSSTGDRCLSGTCQPLNARPRPNWPDVPFDLICTCGASCQSWLPSFFSTVRLRVRSSPSSGRPPPSQYRTVDTYDADPDAAGDRRRHLTDAVAVLDRPDRLRPAPAVPRRR